MSSKGKTKKAKKEWSPNGYIFAALRRVFRWSPERKAVLKAASDGQKGRAEKFKCHGCANYFPRKKVAVDHVNPVVDVQRGFVGWDEYANRLFCPREGLQVLCKVTCHAKKTKDENAERRKVKKGLI